MTSTQTKTQYFVSSSVLGGVVTELDQSGAKSRTFVYQGGEILAWQQKNGMTETMAWEHRDPSNASVRSSTMAAELEPMGSNAGVFKGFVIPHPPSRETLEAERTYPFFAATTSGQCILDGIETPCSMVNIENSAQCPPEGCGPQWNPDLNNGKGGYDFFEATVTGNRYRHWVEPDRVTKYRPDGSVYGEVTYGEGHWAYTSAGSNHPESFLEHAANFGTFPQSSIPEKMRRAHQKYMERKQQKLFYDCAKDALRTYRWGQIKSGAKAIGGASL